MPLFRKSRLSETVSLGIWKIEETPDELRRMISLSAAEDVYYESLRSDLRKKHWLSYRNILSSLMEKQPGELVYDEFGKLHPVNWNYHLSVTHSGIFSAAIVSGRDPVGIDVEMLRDRVERVKERFLSEAERSEIGERDRLEKLCIYWGAKESLYKLYGKPVIEFGRDIIVSPFEYTLSGKGRCSALLKTPEIEETFTVWYEKIEDYMLVYTPGRN